VFALTRNPIYLGLTLAYVGTAVLTGATWALVVLPVVLLIVDRSVIAREEQYLGRVFGEDYMRYRTHTRRWI
jgi:protein-S-isoprenylcysteine O-methyltransferase Ste14